MWAVRPGPQQRLEPSLLIPTFLVAAEELSARPGRAKGDWLGGSIVDL